MPHNETLIERAALLIPSNRPFIAPVCLDCGAEPVTAGAICAPCRAERNADALERSRFGWSAS